MYKKQLSSQDWERVELYMKAGATQKRIAESLGLEPDTLRARFKEKYGEHYQTVNQSFRTMGELLIEATQFQKALAGNIQLLIWLGKVRCGQREPELLSTIPPQQNQIDKDHIIMQLKHKINTLNEQLENRGKSNET